MDGDKWAERSRNRQMKIGRLEMCETVKRMCVCVRLFV